MRKPILYYKVPEKNDQFYVRQSALTLVGNELFTLNEVIKNAIPISILIPEMISPDNVFFSFGCRFKIDE